MRSLSGTFFVVMFLVSLSLPALAQWNLEWSSSGVPSGALGGWLQFQKTGDNWQYRYYSLDTVAFRIMDGALSQTPQYVYVFSPAERLAGELIYSLGVDLTGDNITEFYVVSAYGTSSPFRQSIKILDITNNQAVFERNLANFSYAAVSVWDVNGDGTLDGVFTRYEHPSTGAYTYEVFNTGVAGAVTERPQLPQQLNLRQNYPNPFNPSTRIDYELPSPARVELEIMNILGQRVKTLVDEAQISGWHTTVWDGSDGAGIKQASGPYYYQILVNSKPLQTRQMLLLK